MEKINEYQLSDIGKTESFISIQLIEELEKINTEKFFIQYKISNFWRGKFFIKRLIKKIFKYKLNQNIVWDKNFWNKIDIYIIKSKINFKKNKTKNDLLKIISNKRKNNIFKYQSMIRENIDLGYPLFITTDCLNKIAYNKLTVKQIYMLDGSRRLLASLLNELKEINILLISLKK